MLISAMEITMNYTSILKASGAIALLTLVSCATAPDPGPNQVLLIAPDGTVVAVDETGKPVDDAALSLLAEALSAEMTRSPDTPLEDHEIFSADAKGNLTHIQSGGICPFEWGDFTLREPTIFRRDGFDVSCNYSSAELEASYTFYIYKSAEDLSTGLEQAADAIRTRYPTAQRVDLNMMGPPPHFYAGAAFETSIDGEPMQRDAVLVMDNDGWRIKLRMTYSPSAALARETLGATMMKGQADRVGHDLSRHKPSNAETESDVET